ncbi:MAG: CBS domain-containing protein, partial [Chloroflexaceae bacterium]|nr:CBS domain-containing protein [Chloroflexaceae bacterium]
MLQHPIMIEPHKRVLETQRMMVENQVYYLPVIGDGKRLLGMVTPPRLAIPPEKLGSLDVWEISHYLSTLTIEKVMLKGKDLHTIGPDATMEEAAERMIEKKVGGLPVLDRDVVIGLITDQDILLKFRDVLGATEPGMRVVVRIPGRRGEAVRLTQPMLDRGWWIMSLVNIRSPDRKATGTLSSRSGDAPGKNCGRSLRPSRGTR